MANFIYPPKSANPNARTFINQVINLDLVFTISVDDWNGFMIMFIGSNIKETWRFVTIEERDKAFIDLFPASQITQL